ncbi:phosphate/phosphite/phosphonate ABC transporter substrate-binding protein [Roseomonas marmotae]|uniref:Phosphate/phosphite/phosphonate ABC transporter substrate-binding protein n=1 Tax=Roseomonas marmotae TaxID=2768161 RepID=A0ABS3KIC3_9PROT|nr:phosphate/phosphite/phosphonate ABC transporter substrate-binding protein [Roseomonas marmotae]MBO1077214.1 phosphate/phosphite/phosphonate ABC transporter substrate-binding protein [Roseomonas marmotae]QTI81145.1 phosphate/phosphite/phosphonate ABC transporter substrate-binding protein [Roseomonas marmotae]
MKTLSPLSAIPALTLPALALLALSALPAPAAAQESCAFRGALDEGYCDANRDMVADAPTDASKLRDPSTIVFTYTPVEDPALYASQFKPFLDHLTQCTGKRAVYFQVTSNAAQVEAMRSGRLHVAGFSTGPTAFAVNLAGAVPFAVKGDADGFESYRVAMLVKADSPYKTLADLKGKRVAHTSATSNSGNLAPRAFFPGLGLTPDKDYQVVYSGGHDRSVMGVNAGDYDAAPVASDVWNRMVQRGQVKRDAFRVIWESEPFPTSGFAVAHDLKPELSTKIRECFLSYRFPEQMAKDLGGNDRFWPATYAEQWAPVRAVADAVNAPYNRAAFDAESRKELEAEARKRAQQQPAAPTHVAPTK